MIYFDPRGIELLVCNCGKVEPTTTRICSSCKKEQNEIRPTLCADPNHNEPSGCKNPGCWKYVKENKLSKIKVTHSGLEEQKEAENQCSSCRGLYQMSSYCGCYVCNECNDHKGLARCYCGWSASGANGRQELEEMGETIEPEDY